MTSNTDKKAAVIGFANLYSMPYAEKYINAVKKSGMQYDMIFWDRENAGEGGDNFHAFREKIDSSKNALLKLFPFYRFKKFVINILKEELYDKIIVMYSLPAVLIRKYLKNNYKNNYIFAYTDYSFEKNPLYRAWIKSVVKNSYLTTVTSGGLMRYLPKTDNILPSHNITVPEDGKGTGEKSRYKSKIVISYIGMIRQLAHVKKIVSRLKNDKRFILNYYGSGFCVKELKEYLRAGKTANAFAHGRYKCEEKKKHIQECDIINNCFANDRFQKYAMTNRFYDAVSNMKPQIVNAGSYSQKIVEENGLGLAIDPADENLGDKIRQWFESLDTDKFHERCREYMRLVEEDEAALSARLQDYLSKKIFAGRSGQINRRFFKKRQGLPHFCQQALCTAIFFSSLFPDCPRPRNRFYPKLRALNHCKYS